MATRSTSSPYQPSPPNYTLRPSHGKRIGGNVSNSGGYRNGSSSYSSLGGSHAVGNTKPNMCCAPANGTHNMHRAGNRFS